MGELWLVHFQDECRRIGSGRRLVEVLSVGPKWVTFRYKAGPVLARGKLARKLWEQRLAGKRPPVKLEDYNGTTQEA